MNNRIKEIADRLKAATPGKWRAEGLPHEGKLDAPYIIAYDGTPDGLYICQTVYDNQSHTVEHNVDADTIFIANAKSDIEYLLSLVVPSGSGISAGEREHMSIIADLLTKATISPIDVNMELRAVQTENELFTTMDVETPLHTTIEDLTCKQVAAIAANAIDRIVITAEMGISDTDCFTGLSALFIAKEYQVLLKLAEREKNYYAEPDWDAALLQIAILKNDFISKVKERIIAGLETYTS